MTPTAAPPEPFGQPTVEPPPLDNGTHPHDRLVAVKRQWEPRPYTSDPERMADLVWFLEEARAGRLSRYADRFVAVVQKRVVAEGDDPTELELAVIRDQPDLNPNRLVVLPIFSRADGPPVELAPLCVSVERVVLHDEWERLHEAWRDRPYPDQVEITADWNWLHDQLRAGTVGTGQKQYAAAYRKEVVGLDTDSTRLELSVSRKYPDVHPDRFVIEYVG